MGKKDNESSFRQHCWNLVNYRRNLIADLRKAGYEIHAIAPKDKYLTSLTALGVNHHHIELSAHGVNLLEEIASLIKALILIKKIRPHLVLTFTIKSNIYGGIATRILRIPFMANITGLGMVFLKTNDLSWRWRILYSIVLTSAYKVFFQNPDDMKLFVDRSIVSKKQAGLLPGSGIDSSQIKVSPLSDRRELKFLFIGRLLKEKGIFEYLKAATAMRRKVQHARFLAVGTLPSNLKERDKVLRELEGSPAVTYLGPADNPYRDIEDADIIVLPSYREGTPRVVLEAAAIGRPVIVSDAPGCSWAVLDQITGLLCAPGDSSDLAAKMERLASMSRGELRTLGLAGRAHIEKNFAESIVITEYLSAAKCLEV